MNEKHTSLNQSAAPGNLLTLDAHPTLNLLKIQIDTESQLATTRPYQEIIDRAVDNSLSNLMAYIALEHTRNKIEQ